LLRRTDVRPFIDRQIALLQAFADQAVIAIENTKLFEEVQARNLELQVALEQQTATSEILGVISRSPTNVQPIFDAIAESSVRLCGANYGTVARFMDGVRHRAASYGRTPEEYEKLSSLFPPQLTRGLIGDVSMLDQEIVHVENILNDPRFPVSQTLARTMGFRTVLSVPMLGKAGPVGAIIVSRQEARRFSEAEIGLLRTFADQAVIAIENARLFDQLQTRTRELSEALEYQTATSDVLNVISRSKFDLQPVLDSIVETAARLCACDMATIRRREGDVYIHLARYGLPAEYAEFSKSTSWHHAGRGSLVGRVLQEGKPVQIPDVLADPEYTLDEVQRRGGFRTMLGVPLLRGADQIGIIVLMRRVVQPFSDKQMELVTAFADQAVIAIENTRLFEEVQARTRELAKTVQDLEIASQHKSQFVANMSHELRTPLAAMLGYAELLQEGIYGAPPEKFLLILTRIRSNGKHLLGLINTVLDISKIEAGQFKLNLAEYALGSIVETVMVATESLASAKKLAFKTEVAKGLPYGLGDEQRLTQVLLNLVGNAIKFTDTGEVCIAAGAANGHFTLSVSDTGPGIPAEECERVFEKFRQVDSSNTRAKGGTGLGLAIAREIIEMHGGRIWVESRMGQGSTFRMELPVRAAAVAGAA
jgi:signal transduction histidine kinase